MIKIQDTRYPSKARLARLAGARTKRARGGKIPDNKILIILGPTSSGKSDIAIKIAKKFNGEIISADSRQVYRGMDIGTGKTLRDKSFDLEESAAEAEEKVEPWMSHGILHHMIDIISPRTNFNVAKFKSLAEKIIENILKRGKLPIICGGTGFWISAIVDDVNFPEVKPDWKLRKKLEKHPVEKLFVMLKKLDSARAKNIDAKNKVRLIRAIEICKVIKCVPKIPNTKYPAEGEARQGRQIPDTRYQTLQIGIKLSREKLYANIEKRVLARFAQGMIAEVKKLHRQGLSWKKIQSFGLAYYWIPLYLQKKLNKSLALRNSKSLALGREKPSFEKKELIEKVTNAEKNYAKRQMTWFKRDKRIKWLKDYQEIEKSVKMFLK